MKGRGWFALVSGLFIIALMSWIWFFLARAIADHRITPMNAGNASFLGTMFVAFALIIGCGLIGIAQGVVMIRTGRRNRTLSIVVLVLFLAAAGTVAVSLASQKS